MDKIKVAKELVKLAKSLIQSSYYDYQDNNRNKAPLYTNEEVIIDEITVEIDSLPGDEQYIQVNEKNKFGIDFDNYDFDVIDYGILKQRASIKKNDIVVLWKGEYGEFDSIDFTELNKEQQDDVIAALIDYLEDDNNFIMEYEDFIKEYNEHQQYLKDENADMNMKRQIQKDLFDIEDI